MVADRVPRSRAVAVALVLMMMLPAVTLLVPTAQAAITMPDLVVRLQRLGEESTATNKLTMKVGDMLRVGVYGNVTTSAESVCLSASGTITVDMQKFGNYANNEAITASFTGTTLAAFRDFQVRDNAPVALTNGADTYVDAVITVNCLPTGSPEGSPFTKRSNGPVLLDNSRPTGGAAFSFITSGADAGKFGVTLSNLVDVSEATADASPLGFATQPLTATSGATTPLTIGATTPGSVSVTLRDANGNTQAATLASPGRLNDFQIYATQGGLVRIEFTRPGAGESPGFSNYHFAYRTVGGASWSVAKANATVDGVSVSGGPNTTIDTQTPRMEYDLTGLTPGTTYEFRAFIKDGAGNAGVPTDAKTVRPAASPNAVAFTTIPAAAGANVIGTVTGTWTAAAETPESMSALRIYLRRANGDYWQNDTNTPWASAPKAFPLLNDQVTPSSGTWETRDFDRAAVPAIANIDDGAYTFIVEFVTPAGVVDATQSHTFIFDDAAPVKVTTPPSVNSYSPTLTGVHAQEAMRPAFYMALHDVTSGFDRAVFTLRRGSGNPVVNDIDGTPVVITCRLVSTSSCAVAGANTAPGGHVFANYTLRLPPVALQTGGYKLEAVAYDVAGNPTTLHAGGDFGIGARLTLVDAPVREQGVLLYDQPTVDASNRLRVNVFTGFTGLASFDPSNTCSQRTCRVTSLDIQGRNRTGSGTGPGSPANPLVLGNLPIPERGPDDFLAPAGDSLLYFDHSPTGTLSIGTIEAHMLDVRARAHVRLSDTVTVVYESPWVRAVTAGDRAGLSMGLPAGNSTVYLNAAAQKITFNATFEQGSLTAAPTLVYTLWNNDTQRYYDAGTGTSSTTRLNVTVNPINRAPYYFYNWTNGAVLPRGEYVMNLSVVKADGAPIPNVGLSRFFAVETTSVTLGFDLANSSVHANRYVRRAFDLNVTVSHGYQNLSGAANFVPRLIATNTDPGSTGTRVLNVGNENFASTLRGITPLTPTTSRVWLNLTLPSNASDASRYDLRVNVTTDSWNRTNGDLANGTALMTIVMDDRPPASGVFMLDTNSTGDSANDELVIHGFASDAGAGVTDVMVRIYDVTRNRTFNPVTGQWVGGEQNRWLSNSTPEGARRVRLLPPVGTQWFWRVHESDGVTLDRNTTYRVDVKARDPINSFPAEASYTIHFDRVLPVVFTPPTQAAPATGFVDWHGAGEIRVTATDNNCLRRVTLNATMPSGRVTGPFEMTGPGGCPGTGTWSLNLSATPLATDEVGVVRFAVQAEDGFGNVHADPRTLNLTVNDTQMAEVKYLRLEPPIVSPGSRSRVVAEVFENSEMDRVRVFFHRVNPDRTYTLLAEGQARYLNNSANGTGEWAAETDTDLGLTNLTLGDYLWEVRAMDKNWERTCLTPANTFACSQLPILVPVSNNAGIFIQQDAPAAGTTFVNASPVFRWKVFDGNVTAAGITLRAGNSTANMTTVTPTNVTDLPPVGSQRTGVIVEHRPNLTGQTSYVVQLSAASQGLANGTAVLSYVVDAVPPTVNATVTGAVEVANKSYAVAATRVNLTASDDRSFALTYAVNGGAPVAYATNVTPSGNDGEWRMDYAATDAAGNAARGTVRLTIDKTGPSINVSKHGDDLLVSVTDAGAGLNESTVRVFYLYGNDTSFVPAVMTKATGNSFRILLPGNSTATGLKYHFEAKDVLGNAGTRYSAADPYVVRPDGPPSNLDPTLTITSPAPNAEVRDKVELRWLAADPEEADLTITIALRTPTGQDRFIQTAGPNNGSYVVDVSGRPAGTYTLVVTASDGERTAQKSVNFVVERGELVELLTPPPSEVEKDRGVPFAVRINSGTKQVESVTYTLLRDNETVATGGMKLSQDSYTAILLPGGPGEYAVLVSVAYADGTSEPQREVATFTVKGAAEPEPGGSFPVSLITLVVLALATIGLAAYAAFVRWPR